MLADYWQRLVSSSESLAAQSQGLLEPARNFLVGARHQSALGGARSRDGGFFAAIFVPERRLHQRHGDCGHGDDRISVSLARDARSGYLAQPAWIRRIGGVGPFG